MKKIFSTISVMLGVFLLLVVFLPGEVFSQQENPNPGNEKFPAVRERLGRTRKMSKGVAASLTQEQKTQIQQIRNRFSPRMDDVNLEIKRKHLDLVVELKKNEPDRKKVDATLDSILNLQRKRHQVILDEYFALRDILTPEQNQFFTQKIIHSMIGRRGELRRKPAPTQEP